MYGEEYAIEIRTGDIAVKMSIAMQMMTDEYREDEEETEDKLFVWTWDETDVQIGFIKEKIDALRMDVANCIALEQLGATFKEASDMFLRRNGELHTTSNITDAMYEADEDLAFLYFWLGCLHSFIFDLENVLQKLNAREG